MNDGGDRGQDRALCEVCKHLRQICGPACIFPPDDAFAKRIFARVIKTYSIEQMVTLITGLHEMADIHHQHAATDPSNALDRSYHMPVVDALMKEFNYCQRHLKFITKMLEFIYFLRQLRFNEDRNALRSAATASSRPSNEHENVVAGDEKGKIKVDIDLNKDPAS